MCADKGLCQPYTSIRSWPQLASQNWQQRLLISPTIPNEFHCSASYLDPQTPREGHRWLAALFSWQKTHQEGPGVFRGIRSYSHTKTDNHCDFSRITRANMAHYYRINFLEIDFAELLCSCSLRLR